METSSAPSTSRWQAAAGDGSALADLGVGRQGRLQAECWQESRWKRAEDRGKRQAAKQREGRERSETEKTPLPKKKKQTKNHTTKNHPPPCEVNHRHGIRSTQWILEAAKTEARRPRQVQTDPGRAVLRKGRHRAAPFGRLPRAPSKILPSRSWVTGVEGGLVPGAAPLPRALAQPPRASGKLIQQSPTWVEGNYGAGSKPDQFRDLVHRRSLGFTSPRNAQQDLHRKV